MAPPWMRGCVALCSAIALGICPRCAGLPAAAPGLVPGASREYSLRGVPRSPSFRLRPAAAEPPAEAAVWTSHERQLAVMLVKALMGSSCLTLAGGLAGFSDSKRALLPGAALTFGCALLSAYTYSLVGTCCDEMGVEGYTQLWSKTISARSAWIPTTGCVAFSAIACQVCRAAPEPRRTRRARRERRARRARRRTTRHSPHRASRCT